MEFDKKHLLYIGGAVASIGALYLYMRSRQTSAQLATAPAPAPVSGGAAGSDAMNAAQLQAATALAIEQGREQSALEIARLQAATALGVVGAQTAAAEQAQRAQTSRAGIAAGAMAAGTPAGQQTLGALAQGLRNIFDKIFGTGPGAPFNPFGNLYESPIGPTIPSGWFYNEATGSWQQNYSIYNEPIGPTIPEGWAYNPSSGSWEQGAVDWSGYATTTGGGSSDWFGGQVGAWDTGAYPDVSGGGGIDTYGSFF